MGVRQLGDAISRLPVAGRREDGVRADRRCCARTPADGLLPVGRTPHPLGRGRRLHGARDATREEEGVRLGAINPNLFGPDEYRLGSLCSPDAGVRARALEHCRECVAIAQEVGSTSLSLWLADGTNYPGQDDLGSRFARLVEGLEQLYAELPDGMSLLVEYKFFEPGFYSTDLPDWGTAALVCRRLGYPCAGAGRHGPSPAGDERRADRRAAARGRASRRIPLQQPKVRRRRSDRRLDRPVRALPDHARDRPGR